MIAKNKVAPPQIAAPHHEPLADFANRFALALYNGDWPEALAHAMRSNDLGAAGIGSDEEVVSIVRRQLQSVLASGKIKTGLSVAEHDQGKTRIVYEENEKLPYRWSVRQNFWDEKHQFENIDWYTSSIVLTPSDIINTSANRTLDDLYNGPSNSIKATIFIVEALQSLNFFSINDLPPDANMKRYFAYSDLILREAQAAAWRFVALNATEPQKYGSIQTLMDAIVDYLDASKLKVPSSKTLREVARKILRQVDDLRAGKEHHSAVRVFVNSTPSVRAKPDIELF